MNSHHSMSVVNSSLLTSSWKGGFLNGISSSYVSFPVNSDVANTSSGFDKFIRVVETTTNVHVRSWNTVDLNASFCEVLERAESVVQCLKAVTNWQKRRLDYQAVYNAYLLQAIDEDEFISETDKFTLTYSNLDDAIVANRITQAIELLDFPLDISDLSDYLGVEPESITRALDKVDDAIRNRVLEVGYDHTGLDI